MLKNFNKLFIFAVFVLILVGCQQTTTLPDLEGVDIEAVDQVDVPAGTYVIPYNKAEIDAYSEFYSVSVEITVTDSDDQLVDVTGETFTVTAGEVYRVRIHLVIGPSFERTKLITVHAVPVVATVTFNLNGAQATGPITVIVPVGELVSNFPAQPIRPDYQFAGWFRDSECSTPWSEEDDVVTCDLTLFAKWVPIVVEHENSEFFINCAPFDDSRIENNLPVQIYSLWVAFAYMETEYEALPDEFGLVYSVADPTPGYNEDSVIVHPITEQYPSALSILWYGAETLPLEDETTYAMRAYVRYEHDIYYGEIVTYETAKLVSSAQSVGVDGIVSGGRYYVDNGTTVHRPGMWAEILEGYEANLNGVPYSSFSQMKTAGYHSLITVAQSDGTRWLHVFELNLWNSPADVDYVGVSVELGTLEWKVFGTFDLNLLEEEFVDYEIIEYGVLFSTTTPFLEFGHHGVTIKPSHELDEDGHFTNENGLSIGFGNQKLYVRGYAIVDGRTTYSVETQTIDFSQTVSGVSYEVGDSYQEVVSEGAASNGYGYYPGASTAYTVSTFGDSVVTESRVGDWWVNEEGVYFIYPGGKSDSPKVVLYPPLGVIEGVEEGATYQDSVVVTCTTWNGTLWMSLNGEPEIQIASGVVLDQPGTYVLRVHLYGTVSVSFTIE